MREASIFDQQVIVAYLEDMTLSADNPETGTTRMRRR